MRTLQLLIFAALVIGSGIFGALYNAELEAGLRRDCISAGGSVIPTGPQFACVRGSIAK